MHVFIQNGTLLDNRYSCVDNLHFEVSFVKRTVPNDIDNDLLWCLTLNLIIHRGKTFINIDIVVVDNR